MFQGSSGSASCAKKGNLKNSMQIKTKGLLEISSKILLGVLKKILFWLLRLNIALKMCSSMSSLQLKGVWSPQAELPAGASSTAGFSSPTFASMYYFVKFFRFSKKNWQIPRVFITQEIPLLKHFALISNQDKNSKYPFGLFHTGKTFQLCF